MRLNLNALDIRITRNNRIDVRKFFFDDNRTITSLEEVSGSPRLLNSSLDPEQDNRTDQ